MYSKKYSTLTTYIATSLLLAIVGNRCYGELSASDDFNYKAGENLAGQSGGTGWNGTWVSDAGTYLINNNGGVTDPATTNGEYKFNWRQLSNSFGADGTTTYLSVQITPDSLVGGGYYGISLDKEDNLYSGLLAGIFGGKYGLEEQYNNYNAATTGVNAVNGALTLLVLRVDFASGKDTVNVFLNPTAGDPEPVSSNLSFSNYDLGTVGRIGFLSSNGISADNLLIGSSFSDVTPVPEPTTWVGASLVLGLAVFSQRRKLQGLVD